MRAFRGGGALGARSGRAKQLALRLPDTWGGKRRGAVVLAASEHLRARPRLTGPAMNTVNGTPYTSCFVPRFARFGTKSCSPRSGSPFHARIGARQNASAFFISPCSTITSTSSWKRATSELCPPAFAASRSASPAMSTSSCREGARFGPSAGSDARWRRRARCETRSFTCSRISGNTRASHCPLGSIRILPRRGSTVGVASSQVVGGAHRASGERSNACRSVINLSRMRGRGSRAPVGVGMDFCASRKRRNRGSGRSIEEHSGVPS